MVMTDDQAKSTMSPEVMPNLYTKLMADGTTFSDYTVTTPLCCPSRAAYMTGSTATTTASCATSTPT